MSTLTDVLAAALTDPGPPEPLWVERRDGHRSATDLRWWRRDPQAHCPDDVELLDRIESDARVVDVGCATGRHLERLTTPFTLGIDTNQTAVDLAVAHGVKAIVADALTWSPPTPVDVVLLLGGGAGLCGRLEAATPWFRHLARWLRPGGRILATSVDWRGGTGPHRRWADEARARGVYPGEVELRLRYRDHVGDWFPWLWLDPATLAAIAAVANLAVVSRRTWGARYAVELRRPAGPPW